MNVFALNIAGNEILEAFASDGNDFFSVTENDDGGFGYAVIIGCHGVVVRACDENGEDTYISKQQVI